MQAMQANQTAQGAYSKIFNVYRANIITHVNIIGRYGFRRFSNTDYTVAHDIGGGSICYLEIAIKTAGPMVRVIFINQESKVTEYLLDGFFFSGDYTVDAGHIMQFLKGLGV